jgi:hypothetical protein
MLHPLTVAPYVLHDHVALLSLSVPIFGTLSTIPTLYFATYLTMLSQIN